MFDFAHRYFALCVAVCRHTIHACTLLAIVAGNFTAILLKFLKKIDLDLDELANAVTKEMVDKYGIKQKPVSAHMALTLS